MKAVLSGCRFATATKGDVPTRCAAGRTADILASFSIPVMMSSPLKTSKSNGCRVQTLVASGTQLDLRAAVAAAADLQPIEAPLDVQQQVFVTKIESSWFSCNLCCMLFRTWGHFRNRGYLQPIEALLYVQQQVHSASSHCTSSLNR